MGGDDAMERRRSYGVRRRPRHRLLARIWALGTLPHSVWWISRSRRLAGSALASMGGHDAGRTRATSTILRGALWRSRGHLSAAVRACEQESGVIRSLSWATPRLRSKPECQLSLVTSHFAYGCS